MLDADLFDLVKTCLTSVLSLPADGVKKGTCMTLTIKHLLHSLKVFAVLQRISSGDIMTA